MLMFVLFLSPRARVLYLGLTGRRVVRIVC
jgi:hypothetical protein